MTGAETRGYILKFRCVYCGRHEVSADYPCEGVMPIDKSKRDSMKPTAKHVVGTAKSAGFPPFRFTIRLDSK
jgi:hypothetical protein